MTLTSRKQWLLGGTGLAAVLALFVVTNPEHRQLVPNPFEKRGYVHSLNRGDQSAIAINEKATEPLSEKGVGGGAAAPAASVEQDAVQQVQPAPTEQEDFRGGVAGQMKSATPPVRRGLALSVPQAGPRMEMQDEAAGAPIAGDAFGGVAPSIGIAPLPIDPPIPQGYVDEGRDRFQDFEPNPLTVTAEEPVSTFSIDVDTASYAFVRRELMRGVLPQPDAVRVEEMINYFPYDYAPPTDPDTPFATHVEIMQTPWNAQTRLLRIGIKGFQIPAAERPRTNLVFLIDSSGSMDSPDKLPLLLNGFRLLLDRLGPEDSVAIVAYAGSAGTVLEPTPASEKAKILAALDRLHAGGSTAGAEGIRQAYQLAEAARIEGGVNRVILATDGDFNVGITNPEELEGFVERKRQSGVFLSVLGFGQGNYNDQLMQVLAQNGNGAAAYIDTLSEARKVLVEEASSTLFPIAKDVKIQVEFNPAAVAEYRLIGYETRLLRREDFNNDKVDAGEIGSGHAVTALYELTPVGADRAVDPLRYSTAGAPAQGGAEEFGFLKIRYKAPDGDVSKLIERPFGTADVAERPGTETRFAAAVAAFGQLLRGGTWLGDFGYEEAAALAQEAKGPDPFGYRAEFINLVRLARSAAALPSPRQ